MQGLRISKQLQNTVSDGLIYEFLQVLAQLMNQLDHDNADEYGELYHVLKNVLHDWQQWPLVQELPVTARKPEQTAQGWRWQIDPVAVWMQHFQAENDKILVVGETFDVPWLDYVQQLADQSHWHHWQQSIYQTTLPTVQTIPLEDHRLLEHIQALAHFKTLKQVTVVMASEDDIAQYYQKVRYALPEWTTVLAQGVQGSREKLYRQLPTYEQSIVFVTPDSLHGQQAQDWTGDVLIWASEVLADSRLVKRLATFLQKRRERPILVAQVSPVVVKQLGLQQQTVSSEQKLRQQYSQWLGLNE
jgi:ATP-dependent DNA helicase DinG